MPHFLSRFARLLGLRQGTSHPSTDGFLGGVARSLFERAEARSGQDPRQAHELRLAANAYLRVVR
jgi:hypothetical protein